MKVVLALAFVATVVANDYNYGPPKCKADNCARAVTGTRLGYDGIMTRQSDCKSYQTTTICPYPITVTDYKTVTVITKTIYKTKTITKGYDGYYPKKRGSPDYYQPPSYGGYCDNKPKWIPAYATEHCTNPGQYASACSCYQIYATTVYAPTSTYTETKTIIVKTDTTITKTVYVKPTPKACYPICGYNQDCVSGVCLDKCNNGSACEIKRCGSAAAPYDKYKQQGCVCITTPSGYYCLNQYGDCGSKKCWKNEDCGYGYVCDVHNCCGYGICSQVKKSCPNNASPYSLFKVKERNMEQRAGKPSHVWT